MATNVTVLAAPPDRVFGLLGDPRSLSSFVVGTKAIRRFDPDWPDPGAKVHHTVGIGPLALHDETEVREVEADRRLVLDARIRPFGVFRVEFDLASHAGGTEVTVNEYPVSGMAALPGLAAVVERLVKLRNAEMTRRLQHLAVRRERQWAMAHAGD
jgi:uncharacterized protein YndB with AHSA1/START domain